MKKLFFSLLLLLSFSFQASEKGKPQANRRRSGSFSFILPSVMRNFKITKIKPGEATIIEEESGSSLTEEESGSSLTEENSSLELTLESIMNALSKDNINMNELCWSKISLDNTTKKTPLCHYIQYLPDTTEHGQLIVKMLDAGFIPLDEGVTFANEDHAFNANYYALTICQKTDIGLEINKYLNK